MKRDLTITKLESGLDGMRYSTVITATNYANDSITLSVGNNEEGFALHDTITVEVTKYGDEE